MIGSVSKIQTEKEILPELEELLTKYLLHKFYPLILDRENGGFLCNLTYNWKFAEPQDKMIVTQARHIWTPARASQFYPYDIRFFEAYMHGYKFLKEVMWDHEFGGFFTMRNTQGGLSTFKNYDDEKRTYGNAFGIYALSAVYDITRNKEVLDFAIQVYNWIESHAYDPAGNGYFQFLTREGNPFGEEEIKNTKATDGVEAPYKDQNSTIHLLEAYTELYKVWPNDELKSRLNNLLLLVRDVITTPKGYMNLFFDHSWNPISFRDANEETRKNNYRLDHVSFGHDYETAFLMLEASFALGIPDDVLTLKTAKKMVDHAIWNGWDKESGGFFEAGYYFSGSDKCSIINDTKNWWAQAEGLNALLMMAKIFPEEDKYYKYFIKLMEYVKKYFIDYEYGGWFEGGLDKEPHHKYSSKGNIWKACYHEGRSLMNCIKLLSNKDYYMYKNNQEFKKVKDESDEFVNHWREIKRKT